MATAVKHVTDKWEWTQVKVDPKITYTVELDDDEAKTLRQVLRAIGGVSERTARKHTDAVSNALHRAGANYSRELLSGNFYFEG